MCGLHARLTDQGLEQDFNSLDAQREASEAARILPLRLHPEGTDRERTGQHNPVRGKVGRKGMREVDQGRAEACVLRPGFVSATLARRLATGH